MDVDVEPRMDVKPAGTLPPDECGTGAGSECELDANS